MSSPVGEGRLGELVDAGGDERLLDLGVCPERAGLLTQDQVVAHARRRRGPDAVKILRPRRLEVEVTRSVVTAVLHDVDGPEGAAGIAGTESQVLVVARTVLPVEVDVEQLLVPQRLCESVGIVEAGHLLVPDLWVDAHHLRVLELVDEGQRMPDGRQENVAPGFVGLRLDGEAHGVSLVEHVLAEQVEGLLVAVECGSNILGRPGLSAFATTPRDEGLRTELGRKVDVVGGLPDREAAYVAVIVGEAPVPEHRMREQVGGGHRDLQPGLVQGLSERLEVLFALLPRHPEREDVVVVEGDAVGPEVREPMHCLRRCHRRPHHPTEHVDALPPHGPEAEGEPVLAGGDEVVHGRFLSGIAGRVTRRMRTPSRRQTPADRRPGIGRKPAPLRRRAAGPSRRPPTRPRWARRSRWR